MVDKIGGKDVLATENVAKGVNQGFGRRRRILDSPMLISSPTFVLDLGSGATPAYDDGAMLMDSGTSGDFGAAVSGGTSLTTAGLFPSNQETGAILIKSNYLINEDADALTNNHMVGVVRADGTPAPTSDNIAIFNPSAGNETEGNVRVDRNGTDFDESVTYPVPDAALDNPYHPLTVVVDLGGTFISPNSTGFWIDGDPRGGDPADAIINETPDQTNDSNGTFFGVAFRSQGGGTGMEVDHMEVARFI